MSLSQKIDLENRIFTRASRAGARIDGVRGVLQTDAKDIFLQVLIGVYNAFFGAENRAFCSEDCAVQMEEMHAFKGVFSAEEKRLGPPGKGSVLVKRTAQHCAEQPRTGFRRFIRTRPC